MELNKARTLRSDPSVGAYPDFLSGGGDMGALVRAKDWATTPLGPIESWPQSLRTTVSTCLNCAFPILVWWGPDLVMLYNDEYRQILGASKHPAALGANGQAVWPEIWDVIGPMLSQVMTEGEATRSRDLLLIMDRNGYTEETYFSFSYSPIRDETGGVGGVFCPVIETTDRVLDERRLRTLSALSEAAASRAKSVREIQTLCMVALGNNRADVPFAALYGLEKDRPCLIASFGADLGPSDSGECWPLARVAAGHAEFVDDLSDLPPISSAWGDPVDGALVLPVPRRDQGEATAALVLGINPRRAFDEAYRVFCERVAGAVSTATANARSFEIERERAETLAEIDRAKTLFFSNVSHEFRTPLTLMLGPIEDALAGSDVPAVERERLDVAHRNALRLLKLVNSLLDFSRIEAGRAQATYEPVDLAALTVDLASNFRSACDRAGLKLLVDCRPLGEPVFVDRDMWEKIVLNLLSNAFKFTFEGEIVVRLRAVDGQVELTVRDTGVGIPKHELPRLFERFHRIEGQESRTYEGSGIGLALVQELVKLHGGAIRADSAAGRGTTFTIRLPFGTAHLPQDRIGAERGLASTSVRADAYVQEALRWLPDPAPFAKALRDAGTPDDPPESDRGVRILLADDNADMRAYVRQLLEGRCEVQTVADGEAALDAIRERRPDLVLADVMMPRLNGFELLRAIRADPRLYDLPVVMLSARAGEESRVEGLEAGADDYLAKPFSARDLLARVDGNLKLAKLRREAETALRESERRYRTLITASSDVVYRMSPDWSEMRHLIGRGFIADTDDPSRGWLQKYIHPDDQPTMMRAIDTATRMKSIFDLEHRVIQADGTLGWAHSRAIPLLDSDGEVTEWIGTATDVTDRKRAEDLQAEQRELLECIASGKPVDDCLRHLCDAASRLEPRARACVLLADEMGTKFDRTFSSTLLPSFGEGIHGAPVDEFAIETCGTAVLRGERVTCTDIQNDGQWSKEWRDLCLAHGIQACDSTPFFAHDGAAIGSFVLCFAEPRDPDQWDRSIADFGANVAAIAIERERATRALRESEAHLTALFAQTTAGFAETDPEGRFLNVNERYCEIVGRTEEELYGLRMQDITHPDDLPGNLPLFEQLVKQGEPFEIEKRYMRPDGSEVWVRNSVSVIQTDGHSCSALAASVDITARKRHEEHQRLLINELNHRVKNTLATVQSMATQTLRNSESTMQARERFEARLIALAKAHDILTQESWEGAWLRQVVEEVAPHCGQPPDRFEIEGPEVWVPPQFALALAMALHELCTNAVKHGALSNDEGKVKVVWAVAGTDGHRTLRLRWTEEGGPPVKPPLRHGFGSRLVERGLRQDLGGNVSLEFLPTGVVCSVIAPLTDAGE